MRRMTAALIAFLLALGGSCGSHHSAGPEPDEFFYDCMNMPAGTTVFATDEAFVSFVNKEAAGPFKVDDAQAPNLLAPGSGSMLSPTTPPQFSFRVGAMASGWQPRARSTAACPVTRSRGRMFSFVGTAYAHCPAVNGENFLFRITREGDPKPIYTALLSVTTFTPSAAVWSKAFSGRSGQTVTLTLARAVFSKGDITNGPFVPSAAIRFTVGP